MEYEIIYSELGTFLRIYNDEKEKLYCDIPNEVINLITYLSKKNCELKEKIKNEK